MQDMQRAKYGHLSDIFVKKHVIYQDNLSKNIVQAQVCQCQD